MLKILCVLIPDWIQGPPRCGRYAAVVCAEIHANQVLRRGPSVCLSTAISFHPSRPTETSVCLSGDVRIALIYRLYCTMFIVASHGLQTLFHPLATVNRSNLISTTLFGYFSPLVFYSFVPHISSISPPCLSYSSSFSSLHSPYPPLYSLPTLLHSTSSPLRSSLQGVEVDNEELESIRSDVRALRTDLGLDQKKEENVEINAITDDVSTKRCENEAAMSSSECNPKSSEIDTKMVESRTKSGRMSTIDAYFTTNIISLSCGETNRKSRSPFPDRETTHNNNSSSTLTPKDDTANNSTVKSVKTENNRSIQHSDYDEFEKFDFPAGMEGLGLGLGLNLFTPSILLLVDEIAALEKDILDRQTDINNKVSS
jgi:hypothetical protein